MKQKMEENQEQKSTNEARKGLGYYFSFGEVLTYYFRKKDPNRPRNINLRMMHGINKISIIMFLIAVIVMVVRAIVRS
ncbi:MAG: DUF6728 family protein [Bacteroidota bacterium]